MVTIWFQLVQEDPFTESFRRFKDTSADKVTFASNPDVADIRSAVKALYSDSYLQGIAPSDLVVHIPTPIIKTYNRMNDPCIRVSEKLYDESLYVEVPWRPPQVLQSMKKSINELNETMKHVESHLETIAGALLQSRDAKDFMRV